MIFFSRLSRTGYKKNDGIDELDYWELHKWTATNATFDY